MWTISVLQISFKKPFKSFEEFLKQTVKQRSYTNKAKALIGILCLFSFQNLLFMQSKKGRKKLKIFLWETWRICINFLKSDTEPDKLNILWTRLEATTNFWSHLHPWNAPENLKYLFLSVLNILVKSKRSFSSGHTSPTTWWC